MRVAVAAFAGLRELLAGSAYELELPAGACVGDAWSALERRSSGARAAGLVDASRA